MLSVMEYVGSIRDYSSTSRYITSTVAVISTSPHHATTESPTTSDVDNKEYDRGFATLTPADIRHKRTTARSVIGTTKPHQFEELESKTDVASGDIARASQFYAAAIWPSVPVQITASHSTQIELDTTRASSGLSTTGVVEQQQQQHTTAEVLSLGLLQHQYTGATNQNSLSKSLQPQLNISTPLYQTSRSIQPSALVPSLERPIKSTTTYGGFYDDELPPQHHSSSVAITNTPAAHRERLESFTLPATSTTTATIILTTTSEILPTASLRQFQTAQNWHTASSSQPRQASPSSLLLPPEPSFDLTTSPWIYYTRLNISDVAIMSSVQPSPFDSGIPPMPTTTQGSLSTLDAENVPPHQLSSASGILSATNTMTHAQQQKTTATTTSLNTMPTPDLPTKGEESSKDLPSSLAPRTGLYRPQTGDNVMATGATPSSSAAKEVGHPMSVNDQALRPAITPSPAVVMESATSNWNWSHKIPINAHNTTLTKDGKLYLFSLVTSQYDLAHFT